MGLFRHSSVSRSTETIPASTTLSARPRLSVRNGLLVTSAVACAGVFYAVSANAGSGSDAVSAKPDRHQNAVQLKVDHQSSTSAASTPENSPAQTQTSTSLTTSVSPDAAPTTNLTVNGQPIPVPASGVVSQTFNDGSGQTSVEVTTNSDGTASNSTSTSLNVNVSSSSSNATFDDNSP